MIFDGLGSIRWRWIIPGCISITLAINLQMIIAGCALPGTDGMGSTVFQVGLFNGSYREIVVSLDKNSVITFGNNFIVPNGFQLDSPCIGRCITGVILG